MKFNEYRKMRWKLKQPVLGEDGKYYYQLLEIRNLYNGRIYICGHVTTNPNDSYMGSGTAIIKAFNRFGKRAFAKRILHYAKNLDELKFYEGLIVDEDFVRTSHTYNRVKGGGGYHKGNKNDTNNIKIKVQQCFAPIECVKDSVYKPTIDLTRISLLDIIEIIVLKLKSSIIGFINSIFSFII